MNYDEIDEKLKEFRAEEVVWVIYIGIIILSFYSNNLERKYFLYNDYESKEKYRNIMILIFIILVCVYYYFFNSSVNDIKNIKITDSFKKRNLVYLSSFASLLILVSGLIFLYIAVVDDELNVEIAFN